MSAEPQHGCTICNFIFRMVRRDCGAHDYWYSYICTYSQTGKSFASPASTHSVHRWVRSALGYVFEWSETCCPEFVQIAFYYTAGRHEVRARVRASKWPNPSVNVCSRVGRFSELVAVTELPLLRFRTDYRMAVSFFIHAPLSFCLLASIYLFYNFSGVFEKR